MSRRWWWRPSRDDDERTVGEPGEGKVLVVTARDHEGDPLEYTWVAREHADQYDDTRWRSSPFN